MNPPPTPLPPSSLDDALAELGQALDHYRLALDEGATTKLRRTIDTVATSMAGMGTGADAARDRWAELARQCWSSGYFAAGVAVSEVTLAETETKTGAAGLLASLWRAPLWQRTAPMKLDQVPVGCWGVFFEWAMVAPCVGTVEDGADNWQRQLTPLFIALAGWAKRNPGAACVRESMEVLRPLLATAWVRRVNLESPAWATARAALLDMIDRKSLRVPPRTPKTREGRRMKVGILAENWGDSLVTRALQARIEAFEVDRFELVLMAASPADDKVSPEIETMAGEVKVLPLHRTERVNAILAEALDALIFADDLSSTAGIGAQLSAYRLAPLQVITAETTGLTGRPEIDLQLGSDTMKGRAGCPVAVMPGSAHTWNFENLPATPEVEDRVGLGLPPTGPVFVSVASLDQLNAVCFARWQRVLEGVSDASLLLVLPESTDALTLEGVFSRLESDRGFSPDRVAVLLKNSLVVPAWADVYLDSGAAARPGPMALALSVGVPGVALSRSNQRHSESADVLISIGARDWVAENDDDYVELALRLVADVGARECLAEWLGPRPLISDAVFAGLAWADGLEAAYDQLIAGKPFATEDSTLWHWAIETESIETLAERATAALDRMDFEVAEDAAHRWVRLEPKSAAPRSILGRCALLLGRADRAVDYFLSALQGEEESAVRWLALADGLRAAGREPDALSAYEAGLRIDPKNVGGWLAIAELARAVGHEELAANAAGVIRRIDPAHPALVELEG